jgi:hypothetical protein
VSVTLTLAAASYSSSFALESAMTGVVDERPERHVLCTVVMRIQSGDSDAARSEASDAMWMMGCSCCRGE